MSIKMAYALNPPETGNLLWQAASTYEVVVVTEIVRAEIHLH